MIICILICLGVFYLYIKYITVNKFTTKEIIIIGMLSAFSFLLYNIPFIKYPQGGGITFFSMIPIMLLSVLFGKVVGITGGIVFGVLKIFNGGSIIHPIQFILDYLLSTMALGLTSIFGNKKINIILGGLFSVILSSTLNIISGIIFFGKYAPSGVNKAMYSIIYNLTSSGLEGILSIGILVLLPISRFEKALFIERTR